MNTHAAITGPVFRWVQMLACAVAIALAACAAEEPRRHYDLPAGDAATMLSQFAEVSGREILFAAEVVRGIRTSPVRGKFTALEALRRLLTGTNLHAIPDERSGAIAVRRVPSSRPSGQSTGPPPETPKTAQPQTKESSPMKQRTFISLVAGWLLAGAPAANAQSTPALQPPPGSTEAPIALSPFEVKAEQDIGYQATNTLAGSRLSTELKTTPAVVGVLTKEFLEDIGATNMESFITWAAGMDLGDVDDGVSNVFQSPQVRARSLASHYFSFTKNYFMTYTSTDAYNLARVEVARGPNSLLYGDGALGGMPTSLTKKAEIGLGQNKQSIQVRYSDWGGFRVSADVNRSLNDRLAVRANVVRERSNGWRDDGGDVNHRNGVDLAVTYRPYRNTTIRAGFEYGYVGGSGDTWYFSDQASNWNGITTFNNRTAGAVGNATGTSQRATGSSYLVFNQHAPTRGILDYRGEVSSIGTGLTLLPQDYSLAEYRPDRATSATRFPQLASRGARTGPRGVMNEVHFRAYTASLDQTFFDGRLALNLAGVFEPRVQEFKAQNRWGNYRLDLTETLPNGAPNPFFKRAFEDSVGEHRVSRNWTRDYRGAASYRFEIPRITEQRIMVMAGERQDPYQWKGDRFYWVNNPALANFQAGQNLVRLRRYWGQQSQYPWVDPIDSNGIDVDARIYRGGRTLQGIKYQQAALVGSYLKRTLHTIIGLRQDTYWTDVLSSFSTANDWRAFGVAPATDYLPARLSDPKDASGRPIPQLRDPTGNPTYIMNSERADLVDPARPHDSKTNPYQYEQWPQQRTVRTKTAGFTWFPIKQAGIFGNAAEGFRVEGGAASIYGQVYAPSFNQGRDIGVRLELLDGKLYGSFSYYKSTQSGGTIGAPGQPASIWTNARNAYRDLRDAALGAGNASLAAVYNTKQAEADAKFQLIPAGGGLREWRVLQANGFEFDLTANPTRNIRLTANLTLPKAQGYEAYRDTKAYAAQYMALWQGYVNELRPIASTTAAANSIQTNLDNLQSTFDGAPDGVDEAGTSKYRANFYATYLFGDGWLKGLRAGGGAQFFGPSQLGTAKAVYGVNPATKVVGFYTPDRFDRYFRPSYYLVTASMNYGWKIGKVRYSAQLNVSNLLNEDKLIFTSFSNRTFLDPATGQTTGRQVPNRFQWIHPRKVSVSLSAGF